MPRDDQYLLEMVEAADRIGSWLTDVSVDVWADDEKLRRAILQLLTVVGRRSGTRHRAGGQGAASRHPGVPWRRVVDFRNVAVHEYFAVEWPTVWHLARHDLPALRTQLAAVLAAGYPDVARTYEQRG